MYQPAKSRTPLHLVILAPEMALYSVGCHVTPHPPSPNFGVRIVWAFLNVGARALDGHAADAVLPGLPRVPAQAGTSGDVKLILFRASRPAMGGASSPLFGPCRFLGVSVKDRVPDIASQVHESCLSAFPSHIPPVLT